MTIYCMERDERNDALVHKVSCGSLDLGTLMGNGNISRLGDFANSELALDEAKKCHAKAVRCLDCCISDLRSHEIHEDSEHSRSNKAKVNPYRGEAYVVPSSWVPQQEGMPDRRPAMTSSFVELPLDRLKQFPDVLLA